MLRRTPRPRFGARGHRWLLAHGQRRRAAAALLAGAVAVGAAGLRRRPGRGFDRLTCAFAGTDRSREALAAAAALAERFGLDLRVATFVPRAETMYPPEIGFDAEDLVAAQLAEQAAGLHDEAGRSPRRPASATSTPWWPAARAGTVRCAASLGGRRRPRLRVQPAGAARPRVPRLHREQDLRHTPVPALVSRPGRAPGPERPRHVAVATSGTPHTGRVPFTASHPAAVLPLLRRGSWVSAALLTGSMAPDLPSFLPVGLTHEQTHPLQAILWPDFLLGPGCSSPGGSCCGRGSRRCGRRRPAAAGRPAGGWPRWPGAGGAGRSAGARGVDRLGAALRAGRPGHAPRLGRLHP